MKKLIYILFLIVAYSCKFELADTGPDSTIIIENHTQDTILWDFRFTFPEDTLLSNKHRYPDQHTLYSYFILPESKIDINGGFIRNFESSEERKLLIFLFKYKTVKNIDWSEIKEQYMILKRFDLTLDDLEKMNWTVSYPEAD